MKSLLQLVKPSKFRRRRRTTTTTTTTTTPTLLPMTHQNIFKKDYQIFRNCSPSKTPSRLASAELHLIPDSGGHGEGGSPQGIQTSQPSRVSKVYTVHSGKLTNLKEDAFLIEQNGDFPLFPCKFTQKRYTLPSITTTIA